MANSYKFPRGCGSKPSKVYRAWSNMKTRCTNKNHDYYHLYGGAGITFDPRWSDFDSFYEDMGEPPSSTHSLERIDGSLGYSKSNCKWATTREQLDNRSTTVWVDGKTLSDACRYAGISISTIHSRMIRNNISAKDALRGNF